MSIAGDDIGGGDAGASAGACRAANPPSWGVGGPETGRQAVDLARRGARDGPPTRRPGTSARLADPRRSAPARRRDRRL